MMAMVDSERESKRLKLESMPGIASGIISASKSASYDESVTFQIKSNDCDLSEFFAAESEDAILATAQNCEIKQACLDAFACKGNNEDALRNAIFKGLPENDGFYFPEGADGSNSGEYKEMELKALFTEFGEKFFNENLVIFDKEQGLLVTTTSKPDLCVLRELREGKAEVKFGEVKHGKAYTKESASRQALLYLHSLLYFYRVKLGIPVDTVYGFVICGHKCKGLESNEYAVGLLKLTSPQGLGDEFVGGKYIRAYSTNDSTGLQLLVHFFTKGNVSNVETALQDQREEEKRAPCLFAVPRSLWKDDLGSRVLVMGGTCAMVFRVPFNKLDKLLEEVSRSRENDICWECFLEGVKQLKDQTVSMKRSDARKVYVKVRTRDTTAHFQEYFFLNMYGLLQVKRRKAGGTDKDFLTGVEDFFETYIVPPCGCSSFCLCVMADRGIPFNPNAVDRNKLNRLLRDLKVKIMGMAKIVFHGDTLQHNFVYNETSESLHLVDFDEATELGKKVPRRSLNFKSSYPWFEALLYPNALRQVGESYTIVQFAASVILMVMLHDSAGYEKMGNLTKKAEELGTLLLDKDRSDAKWQDEKTVPDDVKSLIEQVDRLVDCLLRTEYADI